MVIHDPDNPNADRRYKRIGLFDKEFRPVLSFSADQVATVTQNGFRVPVSWSGGQGIPAGRGRLRLYIRFEGIRPEHARLYALYSKGEP